MEIESLLVNVMQRTRQLKMETMILDNCEKSDIIIVNTPTQLSKAASSSNFSTPTTEKSSLQKKFKSFSEKPSSLTKNFPVSIYEIKLFEL